MQRVPVEVLDKITSYLIYPDLLSTALVCRGFAAAVLPIPLRLREEFVLGDGERRQNALFIASGLKPPGPFRASKCCYKVLPASHFADHRSRTCLDCVIKTNPDQKCYIQGWYCGYCKGCQKWTALKLALGSSECWNQFPEWLRHREGCPESVIVFNCGMLVDGRGEDVWAPVYMTE